MEHLKKLSDPNNNLHDFQIGVLLTYRNNPIVLKEAENSILLEYVSLSDSNCKDQLQLCFAPDAEILSLKRNYTIKAENAEFHAELRTETVYNLESVFARESYKDGKTFGKKVSRWLNWAANNKYYIQELTLKDKEIVYNLYQEWISDKTDLDKAMIKRYQNCIDAGLNQISGCKAFGIFNNNGKLIGVRIIYLKGNNWAFDLISFATHSDYPQLGEVFRVNLLQFMMNELNVKYFNLGLNDGEKLTQHKHSLPHEDLEYWVVR